MKLFGKSVSLFIVALFLGSFAATIATNSSLNPPQILAEEDPVMSAPPSPGHPVWAEYVGADFCPPCMSSASPSINELKNEHDKERLRTRATCAKYWLEHFAPEDFRYTVNTSAQPVAENMQDLFTELAEKLVSKEWTDDELHEEMYVLCTNHDIQHKDFFKEAYKLIISKEKGPRLAAFILQVGRARVARLFKPINTE